MPRVAGHRSAEIWHVLLSEGGAVPRAVKLPKVPAAIQIALNTLEARSHIVSNGAPNHYTRRWFSMPPKNSGSQIAFTSVASNRYAAIIVAGLVRKHYFTPLSTPVTAFTCPLQSEALVVSEQWKPTQWHASHYSSPQKTATRHTCTSFHVSSFFGSSTLTEQDITLALLVT